MHRLLVITFLLLPFSLFSQDSEKIVTLVASGQGATSDIAKQNALRNALEQAFGTFISARTEILDDDLVKDEIVSIANGNIQAFEILSEAPIPGGGHVISVKANVSVTKLASFAENKGIQVEFKGNLFAFNIKQQALNEANEVKAIGELCNVLTELMDASFDYTIETKSPIALSADNSQWMIPLIIGVKPNGNLRMASEYWYATLKGLSLSSTEAQDYVNLGKTIYPITYADMNNHTGQFYLRNRESILRTIIQIYRFNESLQRFTVSNGISQWRPRDLSGNIRYIYDNDFRIFLRLFRDPTVSYGSGRPASYHAYSVFYDWVDEQWGKVRGPGNKSDWNELYYRNGKLLNSKGINLDYDPRNKVRFYPDAWTGDLGKWAARNQKEFERIDSDDSGFDIEYFIKQHTVGYDDIGRVTIGNEYGIRENDPHFSFCKIIHGAITNQFGLVISFIGVSENKEIIRIYYDDKRSLEEIDNITQYKIQPIID